MIAILKDKKITGNKSQVVSKLRKEVQNKRVDIYWTKEQKEPLRTFVSSAIYFAYV